MGSKSFLLIEEVKQHNKHLYGQCTQILTQIMDSSVKLEHSSTSDHITTYHFLVRKMKRTVIKDENTYKRRIINDKSLIYKSNFKIIFFC